MPQPKRTGANPKMLRWARDDAGLSLEEAARRLQLRQSKLGTPSERLGQYERGDQPVPSTLVHRMCRVYRQPFVNFFTAKPPIPGYCGTDFRTLPEPATAEDEGSLRAIRRDLFVRQSVVRECMEDSGDHDPLPFVGTLKQQDGIDSAVDQMHELLGTNRDGDLFDQAHSPRRLFEELRAKLECLGVFVLIANDSRDPYLTLSCKVFSGIAISDEFAPFIAINGDDPTQARTFALIHQFAHLLIGTTGVCNAPSTRAVTSRACETETFCDGVAAEFLVPSNLIATVVDSTSPDHVDSPQFSKWVDVLARRRHVSRATSGYQLLRNRLIRGSDFVRMVELPHNEGANAAKRTQPKTPGKRSSDKRISGGRKRPTRAAVQKERLGEPLIQLLRSLVGEQEITYTTAALALGMPAGRAASLLQES